jgi:undecaprenyl-phosphate 4-deoxy-4-formamido-L-arabinose transferase
VVDVSVVIPCYQEGDGLPSMLEQIGTVLDEMPGTAELVLVDDGSADATGDRAVALAREFRHPTRVVRLVRNFGQHPAVFAGLEHTRGAVVVTMDSDLQYPPHEIVRLVAEVSPEWPVVSGYRADRRDPWLRRTLTRVMTRWLNRQTKTDLQDFGSMFRAYDRTVVKRMLQVTERHRFVPAVVAWLGVPIKEIPVEHHGRDERGSRYRLGTLADMFLDLVTGYAVFPLRVLTALGLAASFLGFVATLIFIAYRIFVGAGVSGTVSAFAVIFFLLCVQLLIIALVGEYVGRIYTEAKGRPYYIVNDVVENPAARSTAAEQRLDPASV